MAPAEMLPPMLHTVIVMATVEPNNIVFDAHGHLTTAIVESLLLWRSS